MRQRVALVATLARLYVGVVLIDRECECRGHRRRIVGVVYDHMCQQQCDQRIGYAAGLRPGNMSQIGARSAYLALRDFDPANVSCGSIVLKKSSFADDRKFSGPLMRFSRREVGDRINYCKNSRWPAY